MNPLTLEPCIHCRAAAALPRMRKDCRTLTKPLRHWPMREPAEVTRDLAPVRQSALRLLALAETYAQGPCVKTTRRKNFSGENSVGLKGAQVVSRQLVRASPSLIDQATPAGRINEASMRC